jgi:hypothetical protein
MIISIIKDDDSQPDFDQVVIDENAFSLADLGEIHTIYYNE